MTLLDIVPDSFSRLSQTLNKFVNGKNEKAIPLSLKEDMRHFQRLLTFLLDEDLRPMLSIIEESVQDLYNLLLIQLNKFEISSSFLTDIKDLINTEEHLTREITTIVDSKEISQNNPEHVHKITSSDEIKQEKTNLNVINTNLRSKTK